MQFIFQVQEFVFFILQYFGYGNVCLVGNDFGNIIVGNFVVSEVFFFGKFIQFFFSCFEYGFLFLYLAVVDFGYQFKIIVVFGFSGFGFQFFKVFFNVLNGVYDFFFVFLSGVDVVLFFLCIGNLFIDGFYFVVVVFLFEGFLFNFQLMYLVVLFVYFFWYGVQFKMEFSSCFINQVNGFIW